uniref:Bifunctional inhibitor/plant lipid transfer protein/seed storage helical domain-containing protein n=1 Tax=Ananas comosus var. bracteatus TaxID=296719 RepID=A0A6V7QKS7_ANACO|nr:unnamed protein product [Ananas comosus var. bracteatus]
MFCFSSVAGREEILCALLHEFTGATGLKLKSTIIKRRCVIIDLSSPTSCQLTWAVRRPPGFARQKSGGLVANEMAIRRGRRRGPQRLYDPAGRKGPHTCRAASRTCLAGLVRALPVAFGDCRPRIARPAFRCAHTRNGLIGSRWGLLPPHHLNPVAHADAVPHTCLLRVALTTCLAATYSPRTHERITHRVVSQFTDPFWSKIVRARYLGSANTWSLWRAGRTGPNRGCYSGLGHVLSVTCLCEAIREGARLGVPVNVTKALALPSLCGLSYTLIVPSQHRGESEDRFGVNERKEVGINVAVTKKELGVDNGGKGNVEMGIRLPDVSSAIKMRME